MCQHSHTEMPQFAYLIASHRNPSQVYRLARALRRASPSAHLVVHHDASKSRLEIPDDLHLHVIPNPVAVEWGNFSLVDMFLRSTAWMRDNLDFDWLAVISGQDYPVQPLAAFEARLASSGQDAFLEFFPALGAAPWPEGTGRRRYYFRYTKLPRFAHYYLLPDALKRGLAQLKTWFNSAQPFVDIRNSPRGNATRLGVRRIRTPFNETFICYGGADWFNLSRKSVDIVHRFIQAHPRIVNYYRHTYIPSESFVQTILLNDPKIHVANDSCRYVDWGNAPVASPKILGADDLDSILASGQPFARKFDSCIDSQILDLLDARIAQGLTTDSAH